MAILQIGVIGIPVVELVVLVNSRGTDPAQIQHGVERERNALDM